MIGHDGRSQHSHHPVEAFIMAAKLSFDERVRIEAFQAAGLDAQQIAQHLGWVSSTIYRERKRNLSDNVGYDELVAQHLTRSCGHSEPRCRNSLRILSWREGARTANDALVTARDYC